MLALRGAVARWLLHGIAGGIVAGMVFLLAEMVMSMAMGAPVQAPLVLIGSIVLGPGVIEAGAPQTAVLLVGFALHLALSAIYGLIFVGFLNTLVELTAPAWHLMIYGSAYGLALWVVNFMGVGIAAPVALSQFADVDLFWNGFIAHTFFYGTVLGAYISRVPERWLPVLVLPAEREKRRAA